MKSAFYTWKKAKMYNILNDMLKDNYKVQFFIMSKKKILGDNEKRRKCGIMNAGS